MVWDVLWTSHIHVGLNQSNLLSNFIECMQVQYNEIKGGCGQLTGPKPPPGEAFSGNLL